MDIAPFANRLAKNLAHLSKWARRRGITCYRVYDRDVPQFPFAIDLYATETNGLHAHVQEFDTGWQQDDAGYTAWLTATCDAVCTALAVPPEHLHLKRRQRQRGLAQYEKVDDTASFFTVVENGLRFEVNFEDYLDTGLFLDHRQTRVLAAGLAKGKRVLNLFAYTGSFSVYAAHAGASGTETVDLSNTYQAWTARNMALNGFEADGGAGSSAGAGTSVRASVATTASRHQLVRADAFTYLRDAAAKGKRFGLIVCDPPSFSNSKKMPGVFDVQRDHVALVLHCHALLAPGGTLLFSTNLKSFAFDAPLAERLGVREITAQTVPEDFKKPPHRTYRIEAGEETHVAARPATRAGHAPRAGTPSSRTPVARTPIPRAPVPRAPTPTAPRPRATRPRPPTRGRA
jgi:23S rRNA (cytosine1962-C5)-methyltransferase